MRSLARCSRRRVLRWLSLGLLAVAGGCTSTVRSTPPRGSRPPTSDGGKPPRGTMKPYTVGGRTYHPLGSADGYVEEGLASWYGQPFHGRQTACGQTYDMYGISAAHKILPMYTRLKVTNLDNGATLELMVNDRGPFVGDRIIDLSYGAALRLGTVQKGVSRVRIESIGAVAGMHDGDLDGEFYVQVGAFVSRDNAENLARSLRPTYPATRVDVGEVGGTTFWRAQAGAWPNLSSAQAARSRLAGSYPGAFILNAR